jgi:hypothetical protein
MAKIILVTAANDQTGEAQRESRLGERPFKWCEDNLKLESAPISLTESIRLVPNPNDRGDTQKIFVKVDQDEDASHAGFYPSDMNPSKVRDLLRG